MTAKFLEGSTLELVAQFFRLADHLQVQATGTFSRQVCLQEALWSDITAREFDGLGLSSALLKPAGWRTLARLFRELKTAQITVDNRVCVHFGGAAVHKLIGMLRSANQSRSRPQTFVGVMRFPRESLSSTFDDRHRVQEVLAQAKPPSAIGDAFSLRVDLLSSVSENPVGLTLHFGWQSNHLHVAVRDDGAHPGTLGQVAWEEFRTALLVGRQGGHKMISLDIAACSSAMTLHHRSVCVIVNGPWAMCKSRLFVMTDRTEVVSDAHVKGVPCVVCARHAQPSDMKLMAVVAALHLDTVRK